jgi:diguanylate cyclase (GGDEF)-like protein/PAS domain S-box-containing protein
MNEQTAQQEAQADHPVNALRQWVNASIARRITAFAFPFTLILTCLLGWGLYQHRSSLVEERITKEFTASVTGASKDFESGVNALLDEHGRLATSTLIITGLASPKGKEAYLDPYFHTYRAPSGLRAIVSVYDTKGNSLAGAGGPAESHENTPWFNRVVALNTTYVDLSDKNNALLLTIARPVQASRTATPTGVVVMQIPLYELFVRAVSPLPEISAKRLLGAGNILAERDFKTYTHPIVVTQPLFATQSLRTQRLSLEASLDRKAALAESELRYLAVIYASVSALIFVLIFWVWRNFGARIADEMSRIVEAASTAVSNPDTPALPKGRRKQEVEKLASALSAILQRNSGSQQDFDDRVAERTMMLQDMNNALVKEILSHKQTGQQLQIAANAIENAAEGVMICNAEGRILSVNKAFTAITGYAPEDVVGNTPELLLSSEQAPAILATITAQVLESGHWKGELNSRRKSGETFVEERSVSAVKDEEGRIVNFIVLLSDVTRQKEDEQRIHYLAHHDSLTGLVNRALFQQRCTESILRANRRSGKLAVMFVDLDHFKAVNDSLGHAYGDDLLKHVSERILDCVRKTDTVARFGGDEFAVLLNEVSDLGDVATISKKILEQLTSSFKIADHEIYVSASIGISFYPDDGQHAFVLIKNADAAMYAAKEQGRNNYQFFSAEMNARALETLMMTSSLRLAIERGELVLEYQPRIDLTTGGIMGAEALIRWNHPTLGRIMPAQFIGIAEKSGLIDQVGEWVVREACLQIMRWKDKGCIMPCVAVNLAARQFNQSDFTERIAAIIKETGVIANTLEIEVTESMVMQDPKRTAVILERMKEMGIAVAIDDFGTGYSSLSYLKRFPIDYIKIDQSFVRGLPHDAEDVGIVRAVVALSKTLDVRLIAEGVDKLEQLAFLMHEGCDQGQGYLISVPLTADAMQKFVTDYDPAKSLLGKAKDMIAAAGSPART